MMSSRLSKTPVIAIVDDDEILREALEALVDSMGHIAAVFASAEEYLRSGLIRNTSCLISDMRMPGMSGLELQQRLIAEGHRVPIIFLTGENDDRIRARGLKAGAIAFLSKPAAPKALMACVNDALKAPCWALD